MTITPTNIVVLEKINTLIKILVVEDEMMIGAKISMYLTEGFPMQFSVVF
jgi:hypothetical protein